MINQFGNLSGLTIEAYFANVRYSFMRRVSNEEN